LEYWYLQDIPKAAEHYIRVVAINPDENSPIKNECDIFINGRMEDVIPLLVEELKKQQQVVQAG